MGYWGQFQPYVSVSEKKAKAERKLKQLQKSNPNMRPVIIDGSAIAKTWWGKSWNYNLEKYADFANRIGRGRSYVRHRAVLDLQIRPGHVEALVQGSMSTPYKVKITISELQQDKWKSIKSKCEGQLDSLQELLSGKFPKALGEIFTDKNTGLFPSPQEINFSCSCPDWAYMCKHVAAVLYGIGARLDEDPSLFFTLRKVEINDLISQAVADKTNQLLQQAEKKSKRVMEDANLSDVFGIDLEESVISDIAKCKSQQKSETPKTPKLEPSKPKSEKEKTDKQKPPVKTKKTEPKADNDDEIVEQIIRRTRKGIDIEKLCKKTGLTSYKLRLIITKLKKHGKIKSLSRGIYIGA